MRCFGLGPKISYALHAFSYGCVWLLQASRCLFLVQGIMLVIFLFNPTTHPFLHITDIDYKQAPLRHSLCCNFLYKLFLVLGNNKSVHAQLPCLEFVLPVVCKSIITRLPGLSRWTEEKSFAGRPNSLLLSLCLT